ncbi:LOW QUALITY PROTEIN: uncharacterized protein LOC136000267 [Caloenas nicobarica]|uniref:LOW QUALITY PROTEIN: uncharacterized protein LOC136000267 n=1 Tax=Caloenas nicobarica TaxID=187106 RepID=UPI0032B7C11D
MDPPAPLRTPPDIELDFVHEPLGPPNIVPNPLGTPPPPPSCPHMSPPPTHPGAPAKGQRSLSNLGGGDGSAPPDAWVPLNSWVPSRTPGSPPELPDPSGTPKCAAPPPAAPPAPPAIALLRTAGTDVTTSLTLHDGSDAGPKEERRARKCRWRRGRASLEESVSWPEAEVAGGVAMGPWAAPSPPREPNRNLSSRAGPPDPHAILGVPPGASPAEIRAAFLARCKEVHPDGDPSDPSRHGRFVLLAEAYGALSRPRPRPRPRPPTGPAPRPRPPPGPAQRPDTPPGWDPSGRYWQQFRPRAPRGPPPHRLLGLCLLLGALGAAGHALAYRYVAGAHAEFLDERDRELRAAYERARSRAGSREDVLRRLREARRRGRGGGAGP